MPQTLDLSVLELAQASHKEPKKIASTVQEHIERLSKLDSILNLLKANRFDSAISDTAVPKDGPLSGSCFVISEQDYDPQFIDPLINNGAIPIADVKRSTDPLQFFDLPNPWNLRHCSAGAAAAAISGGGAVFSATSDRCGELILSANFCGTIGLRPSPNLSAHGWHSRKVDDIIKIFECVTKQKAAPTRTNNIWFIQDFYPYQLDPIVEKTQNLVLECLGQHYHCNPIETPIFSQAFSIWATDWKPPTKDYNPQHPVGVMVMMMHQKLNELYPELGIQLREIKHEIFYALTQLLHNDGVLVCPCFPHSTPHNQLIYSTPMDLTLSSFFRALNLPSLHVPVGFSPHGTPLGVQLIGAQNNESNLFEVGKVIEERFKGWVRSQPFSLDMSL
ncbi:MAG: amidase family protein [Myxococcota bacterium]|nr:amidase family protein [Myxococcota bacterium]